MATLQLPGTLNGNPVLVTVSIDIVSIEATTAPPPPSTSSDPIKIALGAIGAYLVLK